MPALHLLLVRQEVEKHTPWRGLHNRYRALWDMRYSSVLLFLAQKYLGSSAHISFFFYIWVDEEICLTYQVIEIDVRIN